jgi:transcriptional regulator with XRE-family HTH domain
MNSDDFANVIRGLEACGLSKLTIARRAGLSRSYVHKIAAGEVRRPSYETVHRLERLQRSLEATRKA